MSSTFISGLLNVENWVLRPLYIVSRTRMCFLAIEKSQKILLASLLRDGKKAFPGLCSVCQFWGLFDIESGTMNDTSLN